MESRPPRRAIVPGPEPDPDAILSDLSLPLKQIFRGDTIGRDFESLYRISYHFVLWKRGQSLLDKILDVMNEWVNEEVVPDLVRSASSENEATIEQASGYSASNASQVTSRYFLAEMNEARKRFEIALAILKDKFMYLFKVHDNDHGTDSHSILDEAFWRYILESPVHPDREDEETISGIAKHSFLNEIKLDRTGSATDRSLIKSCATILLEKSSDTSFESDLLQASREFFRTEKSTCAELSTPAARLRHFEKRKLEELDRCQSVFPESTTEKVLDVLREEMYPLEELEEEQKPPS